MCCGCLFLSACPQYITKFGEVALTEAADLVSEMHNGKEIAMYF
jgi:hypothetical protein